MTFINKHGFPIDHTNTFPCINDSLYVESLKDSELLVSYQPYLIIQENGLVVGLNENFTQFYHLNAKREVLNIIELSWKSECSIEETQIINLNVEPTNMFSSINFFVPLIIMSLSVGVLYAFKHH